VIAGIVGEIILGWLLADLLTAFFHWWEDRVGNPNWRIIGPWLILPNRLHHDDPLAFIRGKTFWDRNRATFIAAGSVGGLLCWLLGPSIWLASTVIGASLSNEIHRYAHEPKAAGKWIKVLQEIGAFQSPKQHAKHHRPPQDANYCVVTDWLNPIFQTIGFWPWLERTLRVR
jgi:sterol desaturase/sphingolipid hydroxylase (fatty acid hydroxylase superfamily)